MALKVSLDVNSFRIVLKMYSRIQTRQQIKHNFLTTRTNHMNSNNYIELFVFKFIKGKQHVYIVENMNGLPK